MMKGKTNTGFEFDVDEAALDDYRLLKALNEVSDGKSGRVTYIIEKLLGSDQEEKLMTHVEKLNDGKCSASGMVAELNEIFEALKAKNS